MPFNAKFEFIFWWKKRFSDCLVPEAPIVPKFLTVQKVEHVQ
jgi:hypothetical protein